MAVAQDKVESLIEALYESALEPEHWADALAGVGRLVGATSAAMMWANGHGTIIRRGDLWNLDARVLETYRTHYVTICPRIRMSVGTVPGQVYDDQAVRTQARGPVLGYYDFLDSNGIGRARILNVETNADHRIGMAFYRPIGRDSRTEEENRVLERLWLHVRRAARLANQLSALGAEARLGAELFELSIPMLLLDAGGQVRRINGSARAVLAQADGLSLSGGHLHAARPADDARLQRDIGAALSASASRMPASDGFALVSRPSGRPAWAVSAVPMPPRRGEGFAPIPPRALVTIAETVPRVSPARLRRGFGLSQAEAEVAAALAGGLHPDEIAAARHASLETVRAQLKSVFAKLEVSTQAQLVGRVASLCGLPAPPLAN